jgi:heme-degrading monooxygenase HmoA
VAGESDSGRQATVARTWRGWTRREDADAYAAYIEQTGMSAYRSTPGNRGAWMLRRDDGDRTEFVTLSFWDSTDAIRGFAGDDIDVAIFYPEDDRFLVERELTVRHFAIEPIPPG